MLLILSITLAIFVLILAGYLSIWRGLIDQAGIRGLTVFVFYFALPWMLIHNIANAPATGWSDGAYALAYFAVGLSVHLAGLFTAKWLSRCTWSEQAVQGIAVSFGNTVFIALPIIAHGGSVAPQWPPWHAGAGLGPSTDGKRTWLCWRRSQAGDQLRPSRQIFDPAPILNETGISSASPLR